MAQIAEFSDDWKTAFQAPTSNPAFRPGDSDAFASADVGDVWLAHPSGVPKSALPHAGPWASLGPVSSPPCPNCGTITDTASPFGPPVSNAIAEAGATVTIVERAASGLPYLLFPAISQVNHRSGADWLRGEGETVGGFSAGHYRLLSTTLL